MNPIKYIKIKTVNMFLNYLASLEVGRDAKYDNILHNISFIKIFDDLNNPISIYEHLMENN